MTGVGRTRITIGPPNHTDALVITKRHRCPHVCRSRASRRSWCQAQNSFGRQIEGLGMMSKGQEGSVHAPTTLLMQYELPSRSPVDIFVESVIIGCSPNMCYRRSDHCRRIADDTFFPQATEEVELFSRTLLICLIL